MPFGIQLEMDANAHLSGRRELLLIAIELDADAGRTGLDGRAPLIEELSARDRRVQKERDAKTKEEREGGTQSNHQNSPTSTAKSAERKAAALKLRLERTARADALVLRDQILPRGAGELDARWASRRTDNLKLDAPIRLPGAGVRRRIDRTALAITGAP